MNRKSSIAIFVTIVTLLALEQALAVEIGEGSNKSRCSEYKGKIGEIISELQGEDKECDVTFIVGDKRFRGHKVVMSAGSPYFEAMFRHAMRESVSEGPIPLHDLNAKAFREIREYIYTGQITICDSNVAALLEAASYLQIKDIEVYCYDHMKNHLNAMNCLSIICIAEKYSCSELLNYATDFALEFFEEVVKYPDFLELTKDQMIDIISDDSLDASEENVYESVTCWIKYKGSLDGDRTIHLSDILQHVRFPRMPLNYLEEVANDPLIKDCKKCLEYAEEARVYLLSHNIGDERDPSEYSLNARFKPRQTNYLFVVGGSLVGPPTSSVEKYHPKTNKWTKVAPMNSPRDFLGVAVLKNILYAVGGYSGSTYLKSIERYDPHTDKWSINVKPLQLSRSAYNCVTTLSGLIYVIGGVYSSGSHLNSVVKYDADMNEWIECKPLRQEKKYHAVGVLGEYIYVLGGYTDGYALNTVERYDPIQNEWHNMPPMITKRFNFGSAAQGCYLYVVGGVGNDEILYSAERYDSHTKTWELISPMNEPRYAHGLAATNGLIYAVGGMGSDAKILITVEVYDPATDTWTERAPMLGARKNFGLIAMKS